MTRKLFKTLGLTLSLAGGLALSQSEALADDTLTLTGLYTSYTMGGEYTSPYTFNINGVNSVVLLACDDINSSVYFGESWQATKYTESEAAANGKFKDQTGGVYNPDDPNASTYTIQQKYDAAAWLAQQLLVMLSTTSNDALRSTLAGEYSFAIWQIFTPTTPTAIDHLTAYDGANAPGEIAAVEKFMKDAFTYAPNADLSNVYFYTPNANPLLGMNAQEFIYVQTPEASTLAFFAFNLLALPCLLLFLRRRHFWA